MQVEAETTKIIHLALSMKEAEWLRSFVQNDPSGGDESEEEAEMREELFHAINSTLP